MAWNRPNNDDRAVSMKPTRRDRRSRPTMWGVATIVVVGAGIAAWWLWPEESAPVAEGGDGTVERRIHEVKPAAARTNETATTTPPNPQKLPPQRVGEVRDGKLLMLSGELREVKGVITSSVFKTSIVHQTFKSAANQQIASILMVEPGTGMLGSSEELFEGFGERFDDSLKEEIKITPEDSDLQRELKQAVIDARKELIDCKGRGEDVAQIMIDTRNQLMELATYRDDLEKQVEQLNCDGNFSDEDYAELLQAANTMLEDRGVKPFEIPSIVKHSVNLQNMKDSEGENDE